MGSSQSKRKNKHVSDDVYSLIAYGYLREQSVRLSIHIPRDIQLTCYKFYKVIDLIINNGETVELFCTKNRIPYTFNSILIKKNGILTVNNWNPESKQGGYLYITCKGNITLRTGARIDLTGKGYTGGINGCTGESKNGLIINIFSIYPIMIMNMTNIILQARGEWAE